MIVTVTLNAAIDRTLTVPNFQRGQRHRASAGLHARRRQGHQRRTRAEAARRAGRCHRLRRRHDRHAHRRGADERGDPERLRADRGRVAHLDGCRRSDRRHVHRDQRVGAGRVPEELETLLEKLALPHAGRRARRLRGLAAAQRRRRLLRGRDPRARAAPRPAVLDTEGEPLRLGVEAEPFLVSPNQREAEALVGQEFHDEEDFQLALDRIAELGRAQRPDHDRARLRRAPARGAARRGGSAPSRRASSRSRPSAPATCCSPRSSPRATRAGRRRRRCAPRSPPGRPRRSRSARAASTRGRPAGSRRASS